MPFSADASQPSAPGFERDEIKRGKSHANFQPRRVGADAGDDLAQETGAILETAAVFAGAIDRAEEFVAEVAVAMFDIHEMETGFLRQHRRVDVICRSVCSISLVGHDRDNQSGRPNLRLSSGWAIQDVRFQSVLSVRAAETPGMGQLQADQQIIRVPTGGMRVRQALSRRLRKLRQVALVDDELAGIGASIRADGHCFAAPDEFRAALPEALPAAGDQVGGFAVACWRPSLPSGERTNGWREAWRVEGSG